MIRRLLTAAAALGLVVACSPDKSATYKRPTPKSSGPTTIPKTVQQLTQEATDCRVLKLLSDQELAKIPPGEPKTAAVDEAKRNLVTIYLREVELKCANTTTVPTAN